MATPRSRQAARLRARQRRAQLRARRLALLTVVSVLLVVTLALSAFGGNSERAPDTVITPPPGETSSARPAAKLLATVGNLRLQLPVPETAVTAIGFHGARDGAMALNPHGRQGNEGLLARLWRRVAGAGRDDSVVWFQLGGSSGTEVMDVGAAPGTDVYAPVDGSVVSISTITINGRELGKRIDLRPTAAPSTTVSIANVDPDPSLAVGTPVEARVSKLGQVVHIAAVEEQALAEHTASDGNNIAISVYASTSLLP
ncbi:MAG: hypothetical protein U0R50_15045 [Gaiellales bacterium]